MTDLLYEWPWAVRRDAYWRTHERRCAACGRTDRVEVHHIHGAGVRYPVGQEPDAAIVALCKRHHRRVHDLHRRHRWLGLRLATLWVVAWGR